MKAAVLLPSIAVAILASSCAVHKPEGETLVDAPATSPGVLSGWSTATQGPGIPEGQSDDGYDIGRDTTVAHRGHASAVIRSTTSDAHGWHSLTQGIRADAFRGKRVRLQGFLKTKSVAGYAGLWMRTDGIDREQEYGTDGDRETGSSDWTSYAVVVDVPTDAVAIFFGPMLTGTGEVWADDLSLDVVDPAKVATNGGWEGPNFEHDPKEPQNLGFEASAVATDKLEVPGWQTPDGTWGDTVHLDRTVLRSGKPTVTLHNIKAGRHMVSIFQEIQAAEFRGKRVQFEAAIKTSGKVAGGAMVAIPGGGKWVVVDVPELIEKGNKWVKDPREWKPVSAVVDVPTWANCIQLGVQLNGPGQMWISGATFKVVSNTTPASFAPDLPSLHTSEDLKSLPVAPVNLNFER